MAHYATLRDYRFSDDVDDLRGAPVYGRDQGELGKVKDVVFNHERGEIRYLVVDIGRGHTVLLASDHLVRSVVDEDAFDTDLSRDQLARLPAFDEKELQSDAQWQGFERRHKEAIKQEEDRLLRQYKRDYKDDPVEHRKGSDRAITPEPDEMPAAGESYRVSAADLTPERLAGKYPDTANTSAKLQMRPAGTPAHAEDAPGAGVSAPRWTGFQNVIRQNLHELRHGCAACDKAA